MKKKLTAILLAITLVFSMTGCGVFKSKFPDYNVTGYINALLNSSYHGNSEDLIEITMQTQEDADKNMQITIDNGSVYFCNAFAINPSDEQMQRIRQLVEKAYNLSKYTVSQKKEISDGYNVDVEYEPITVFADSVNEATALRSNTQLLREKVLEKSENTYNYPNENTDENDDEDEETSNVTVDSEAMTEVFIDEVINMCESKLNSNFIYGEKVSVTLKILRTADGQLQIDTTQLEEIDTGIVLFQNKVPVS